MTTTFESRLITFKPLIKLKKCNSGKWRGHFKVSATETRWRRGVTHASGPQPGPVQRVQALRRCLETYPDDHFLLVM